MDRIALQTRKLTKRYKGRAVVNQLDLTVREGEIYGFLGPNGAGKTTTMRMILGLVLPDEGEIEVLGLDAVAHRQRALRNVGAVVEAPSFYLHLTARRNLRHLARLSGECSEQRIAEVLELVGLKHVADDAVGTFSFGMKQRLGIAQALIPKSKLILLDEPTNGLDPHGIKDTRELMRRLCRELGVTIFLSSHLLSEVEQVCDRVGIINNGTKILEDEVASLMKLESVLYVDVSEPARAAEALMQRGWECESIPGSNGAVTTLRVHLDSGDAAELNYCLVQAGVRVHRLLPSTHSLEELFVTITENLRR
jgi:ABC-2 type transport system ATP-binding protein